MHLRQRSIIVTAALATVIAVAGCSSAATPTPQGDAEAAVCSALQTWSDEMREFTSLDPTTASIEDATAQRDVVADAWDDVKTALQGVTVADEAAVEAAAAGLVTALTEFPTDVPVADAIDGVKTAAEPLRTAYKQMADGMDCVIATPY